MFILAARTEGRNPPTNPIIIAGDNANEKASSENELKFNVEIEKNWRNEAKNIPIAPPANVISSDSSKKAERILLRLNLFFVN